VENLEETEIRVLFGTWLANARTSERDSGVNHRELASYASRLTPYIQGHMSEALHSLEKLYAQLPPTVMEEGEQREAWEGLREEYIRTTRVALDHIAATLASVGCTDAELSAVLDPEVEAEAPSTDDDDETTEIPLPRWVTVKVDGVSLSPSDVACVTGTGTKK
jgi:hypothetical protein